MGWGRMMLMGCALPSDGARASAGCQGNLVATPRVVAADVRRLKYYWERSFIWSLLTSAATS